MNFLTGKKTYIIATATVLYAVIVVGIVQGDWTAAVGLILGGTGLGALRSGVNTVKTQVLNEVRTLRR